MLNLPCTLFSKTHYRKLVRTNFEKKSPFSTFQQQTAPDKRLNRDINKSENRNLDGRPNQSDLILGLSTLLVL